MFTRGITVQARKEPMLRQKGTMLKLFLPSRSNTVRTPARPQNQLYAAKEQHKDLCNILQAGGAGFQGTGA
jgi:hypothetical protein